MDAIAELVEKHKALLMGSKQETEASLQQLESSLDVVLPSNVRWFLKTCGYSSVNAIPNISQSISDTKRFRTAVGLPKQYIVIDDRNDGGAVLLDTTSSDGEIIWIDTHALVKIGKQPLALAESDFFPNFSAWVSYCIESEADENAV